MRMTPTVIAAALAATLAAPAVLADGAVAASEAMRVVRDKETGQLRAPNNDELKQMLAAEKAARKAKGLPESSGEIQAVEVRTHANGMKSAQLGPEFLVSLEARRDAEGNLVVTHAQPGYDVHAAPANEQPTE
jgi:hypothetical protein